MQASRTYSSDSPGSNSAPSLQVLLQPTCKNISTVCKIACSSQVSNFSCAEVNYQAAMSILGNPSTCFMQSGTKINIDFKSAHPKWCCIFPRNDITNVSSKHIHELTLCYVTQCNLTPVCKHILNLREISLSYRLQYHSEHTLLMIFPPPSLSGSPCLLSSREFLR